MLTLTNQAVSAIRSLIGEPYLPEDTGLRIASATQRNGASGFAVEVTPGPGPEDQVIETEGARVFLDPVAATALDDKALDAQVSEQGQVHFHLSERLA